jgi:UMF1 family MFS transporter
MWGPFVFGIIRQVTGTSRLAILSLVGFFIIGIVLLCFVKDNGAKPKDKLHISSGNL